MSSWSGRRLSRLKRHVIAAWGVDCWRCHQPIDLSLHHLQPYAFTIDHVLPRARGGSDDLDNLRPAHRRCNLERGAKLPSAGRAHHRDTSFLDAPDGGKTRPTSLFPPDTPQKRR